jgi:membrane protease YdiL (CAAX protease family)
VNSKDNRSSTFLVFAAALGQAALIMLMHPIWAGLSVLNLAVSPRLPWAAALEIIFLWILWRFLAGSSGSRGGRAERHALLKWNHLSGEVWAWSALAGGAAMVCMFLVETHSCVVAWGTGNSAAVVPGPLDFAQMTKLTGISFALVTSAVAALVEESAFRGYMQSQLEKRFAAPTTFAIVALTFSAFHLYGRPVHLWLAGIPDWIVISLIFSYLVRVTKSLVPAVICHFVVDAVLFSLDWFDDPLRPLRTIVPGAHASVGTLICGVSALISILAFRSLAKRAARLSAAA